MKMTDIDKAFNIIETSDVPTQLANINYRLDILITIILFAFVLIVAVSFCYLIYRYILRFM